MKKVVYIILTMIFLIFPFSLNALTINGLESENVLVYNLEEDKILYEKNSEKQTSIASLTKIMTTLVAIENIKDLNAKVTITEKMLKGIPSDASVAGLKVGDTLTYEDLLYSSMIPSGADATNALAISLTGSITNFVDKMNEKATALNLNNTHFINTTGLDIEGHYSTAKDILTLLKSALKNETFKKVFQTKKYKTTNGLELKSTTDYYNKSLNYDISYILGSKTGYTSNAGLCLATLSNIDNTNIITITINAPYTNRNKNIIDLNKIYTSLKENYKKINIIEEGEILKTLETKYTKENNFKIRSTKNISRYIEGEFDDEKLEIDYNGEDIISCTTKKGSTLGKIKIKYNDELIEEMPVVLTNNLHFSIFKYLKENIFYYITLIVIILITIKILKKKKKID